MVVKIMIRLYHATPIENLGSILKEGIKPSFGLVYASTDKDTAAKWISFTRMWSKEIVVIAFDKNESEIELGNDHSPMMLKLIGANPEGASYTCDAVAPEEIILKDVWKYQNPFYNKDMPNPLEMMNNEEE
jgi:hypothetical protein